MDWGVGNYERGRLMYYHHSLEEYDATSMQRPQPAEEESGNREKEDRNDSFL